MKLLDFIVNLVQMIVENKAEETAEANGDETSGLLKGDNLGTLTGEAMREKVELLQNQTNLCGQGTQGIFQTGAEGRQWCDSHTFAVLNLCFLLIYVLDVVFKVSFTKKLDNRHFNTEFYCALALFRNLYKY